MYSQLSLPRSHLSTFLIEKVANRDIHLENTIEIVRIKTNMTLNYLLTVVILENIKYLNWPLNILIDKNSNLLKYIYTKLIGAFSNIPFILCQTTGSLMP